MKKFGQGVIGEPALVAGAVMAILNVLVALNVWTLTEVQLGTINTALAAVLALVVRAVASPNHGTPLHAPKLGHQATPAH